MKIYPKLNLENKTIKTSLYEKLFHLFMTLNQ